MLCEVKKLKKKHKRERLKALEIAKQFEKEFNADPNNNFSIELFTLTGVPGEWSVGYNLYSRSGNIIDGPLAMIIDENDKIISLEEFIMRSKE